LNGLDQHLEVFPNPTKDFFTLRYNAMKSADANITLIDASGRILFDREVQSIQGINEWEISMVDFNSGIFVLKFESTSATVYRRVVVID